MAQPTDAQSHLYDRSDNPMIADQQAAVTAIAATTAFTAPATGTAKTVTTNDAADLTTVADALKVLRDEVALIETTVNLIITRLEAHGFVADN
jgi:hypothetical protein